MQCVLERTAAVVHLRDLDDRGVLAAPSIPWLRSSSPASSPGRSDCMYRLTANATPRP